MKYYLTSLITAEVKLLWYHCIRLIGGGNMIPTIKSSKIPLFPFFLLYPIFLYTLIMSDSLKQLVQTIIEQEEKCQFTSFTSEDALSLGLALLENAKPFKKSVVIDITLNGHQLFHYAMNGTSKDNDEWVRRKK